MRAPGERPPTDLRLVPAAAAAWAVMLLGLGLGPVAGHQAGPLENPQVMGRQVRGHGEQRLQLGRRRVPQRQVIHDAEPGRLR